MKRITSLTCSLFMFIGLLKAQSDDSLIFYKVTNYSVNGKEMDELAIQKDIALAFLFEDDNIFFANCWRKSDSYSHGRVYSFKKISSREESETKHKSEVYLFTWKYENTYDDETGEASVRFTKVFIGTVEKFQCEIVSIKDNSTIVLKGYLER